MSIETVRNFMRTAETNPEIQKKLQAIPKGGGQWTIREIVKVAEAAGFTFTPQDYEDAVNQLLTEKHMAGVLDDTELAIISGGLMCVSTDGTYCLCCPNPKPKDPSVHPIARF